MRRRSALALFIVCALGSAAHADLATGRDKLIAGDYKTAIAELAKASGKERTPARILLARAQVATGDYAAAEATIAPLAACKDAQAIEARLLLDEINLPPGSVFQDGEIPLLQVRDRLAVAVQDSDVDRDDDHTRAECSLRRLLGGRRHVLAA